MDMRCNSTIVTPIRPPITTLYSNRNLSSSFLFRTPTFSNNKFRLQANNKNTDPLLQPTLSQQQQLLHQEEDDEEEDFIMFSEDEDEDEYLEDEDEYLKDEDEYLEDEDEQLYVGDGEGGGGVRLAGTWWDKEALSIAEKVCDSFDGELGIYAFKTLANSTVRVRIQTLTNKSGSPSMEDIEAFSATYRTRLDEAEVAKTVPNLAIEVSSPGVERVVRIPEELDRFKDRNLYVKYVSEAAGTDSASEGEGVFRLITFDVETKCCTWGLADVRINREKAGKGRPLSKKQKDWRLNTPFESLRLVRLYSDC